jgi:hypothetical protein
VQVLYSSIEEKYFSGEGLGPQIYCSISGKDFAREGQGPKIDSTSKIFIWRVRAPRSLQLQLYNPCSARQREIG